jgi:hypothetical protein
MPEITSLDEWRDYANFSEFVIPTALDGIPGAFQKRRWVPGWLWRMVAERYIDPIQFSIALKQASDKALKSLLTDAYADESPATSADSSTSSRTRL